MAWNHVSHRASIANENRGADCRRILMSIGSRIFQCDGSVDPCGYRVDVFRREASQCCGSLPSLGCLQLAYCFLCLIACLLFEPLCFDLIDGNTLLSRLI